MMAAFKVEYRRFVPSSPGASARESFLGITRQRRVHNLPAPRLEESSSCSCSSSSSRGSGGGEKQNLEKQATKLVRNLKKKKKKKKQTSGWER
jgi:hypothetical protein